MENERCSLCLDVVDEERADILTMGAYGTPKYVCPECARKIEEVTSGVDYESIVNALDELNSTVLKSNIDNHTVLECITQILSDGAERAKKIKDGTFDFEAENEECEEEEFDITEDLQESEEDKLLDEQDAIVQKKFDKITSVICAAVLALTLAYLIWYFFIS